MPSGLGEGGPWAGGITGGHGVLCPGGAFFEKMAPSGGPGPASCSSDFFIGTVDFVIFGEVGASLPLMFPSVLAVLLQLRVYLSVRDGGVASSVAGGN
jgi:hypothetical protein